MKKTTFYSLLTMLLLLFVGSNVWADTYSHTFVTTDIPAETTETEFTLSGVDWTLTLDGGKVSVFSNDLGTHFGTNNATCNSVTLSTEGIPGTIASVTVEASRGSSLVGALSVSVGGTDYTYSLGNGNTNTSITTTNSAYEFDGSSEGEIAIVWTKTSGKGAFYIKKITIEYSDGGIIVAKPVISPAGGTFTEPQTVTITAEADAIFYTLDGTDPTTASTQYTEPFIVSEDCVVKAVAYDVTGVSSSIAEAEFKFNSSVYTNIAALCADATSTSTPVLVEFNNWICTGVKGTSNAYFTDGRNGILLYEKTNGFELGDQLTGSAQINLTLYNECAEITGLKSTTAGVTVTKGATATPITVAIGDLQKDMQGCVITVKDVTYNATDGVFIDGDDNRITPYGSFITLPELVDGATYDITGVAIWFVKNGSGYWEIAPRSADEFQLSGSTVVVTKPIITPNGGTFAEAQEVTITAEEGCTIIYTTDGAEPGMTAGTQYTAPFTISEDCVVKAIAFDATGASSAVASAEFKFISATAIPSIARLCAAAPAEGEVEVLVEFNNWIVTGVRGGQVYFTDGSNGIVLYQSGHGFKVGDKVTGSAVVTLTTFNECAEILGLSSTTEGISVEAGATPTTISRSELSGDTKDKQGCLLYLEGVTYTDGVFVDDDDNTIEPMANKFISLPTLMEGKTYNVTGVAIWYITDGVGKWMIAPRAADEIVLVTSQETPVSSWSVEEEVVDINGEVTAVFTTNSDGAVTYESSDETVAIIDAAGIIRPVGRGVTTITAYVAETETYLPDSKSFILTVIKDGYAEATFKYNDEDIVGQGAQDVGAELTATRNEIVTLYANRAYAKPNDTHIKVYGTNETNGPSYLQLSVVDGYAITEVVLTVTGKSYLGVWKDQFGAEPEVDVPDSVKATWTGMQNKVVLTNWASKQARVKTIDVTYVKLAETDKTVTIGETGIATYCSDVTTVVSLNGEWTVAGAVTGFAEGSVLTVDTLSSVIPANAGMLLMGAPGEYKVYTHVDLNAEVPTTNMLTGVLEDTPATIGSYVFQENKGIAGFYQLIPGTSYTVPAGQAYLSVEGVAAPAWFFTELDQETMDEFIEDITTGIDGVAELSENGVIYNVAGQRLSKMQKGINIVSGKKIIK